MPGRRDQLIDEIDVGVVSQKNLVVGLFGEVSEMTINGEVVDFEMVTP